LKEELRKTGYKIFKNRIPVRHGGSWKVNRRRKKRGREAHDDAASILPEIQMGKRGRPVVLKRFFTRKAGGRWS